MSTYSNISYRTAAMLSLAVAVLCVPSCTAERPSPPAPARSAPEQAASAASLSAGGEGYALMIEPRDANRRTTLLLRAEGFSLRDGKVIWQVNGVPAFPAEADRFDCAGAKRGETVRAIAVVNGREIRSNDVVVGNTPPELFNVNLLPVTTAQGESLAVSASASDADDDKVTVQYTWTVNDVPAGNGENLNRALKRNDSVRVDIKAHDGQAYGDPIVLNRTIANHAPLFIEHQNFTLNGGTVAYRAQALDVDGDQITFALASPVEGMSIDKTTGNLSWKVPPGFRGEQPVTVVADDGHLGTAQYTVTFMIRE